MGKDAADVRFDLSVGEAQDEQVPGSQYFVAGGVVFLLRAMDGAVKLDDEAGSMAVEVYDEAVYDLLATPTYASKLTSAQTIPEQLFRAGHVLPEFSGALDLHRFDPLAEHYGLIGCHAGVPF